MLGYTRTGRLSCWPASGSRMRHISRASTGWPPASPAPASAPAIASPSLSQNNLEFVDLYGAAARLGAIVVPINWRLSAEEITYIFGDAAPKVVIADAANQQAAASAQSALSAVERWYGIGGNIHPSSPTASLSDGSDKILQRHTPMPMPASCMIHTAAVGGRPRGALLSHANLIAASLQLLHYWSLTPDDVNLGVLPLFHVAGLGMLLAAQHAGGASM